MERITRSDINEKLQRINKRPVILDKRIDLSLDYYSGAGRIQYKGGSSHLSPRLKLRELDIWLDGFETALDKTHA